MYQQDMQMNQEARLAEKSYYPLVKRGMDVVLSLVLLALLLPFFAVLSILIMFDSPGNPIFVQERVGRGLRPFKCLKFRSMHTNAEAILAQWRHEHPQIYEEYRANNFKLKADPRVTRMGRFIRRFSIDELPQLFNVLIGQMSLVGPRPLLERELKDYVGSLPTYGLVRPGISGLWQVSGRSDTTFADRARLDSEYVRTMSLRTDIKILISTVLVVLGKSGAY